MITETAEQTSPFVPLTDIIAIDELFRRSSDGPVIFFKHSLTCSISSAAYQEMQRLSREVALVVLQDSRDVSLEIERRTGVRHESPQLIIVRNGTAIWHASHWAIRADAVEGAFREFE